MGLSDSSGPSNQSAQVVNTLTDYSDIVDTETISRIRDKARGLRGSRVLHINSTRCGGGVAEILSSLVPLMNDLGISTGWEIIDGRPEFFKLTKAFHNGLQGSQLSFDKGMERLYLETNQAFSECCDVDADCVIVHDPQPLPLIEFCDKKTPWVWRCHVDLSCPDMALWDYLCRFVHKYDMCVLSSKGYVRDDLPVCQRVVHPAIDPLSPKNAEMPSEQVSATIRSLGIPMDKPIVAQVSRMDAWKDPEGLVEVFDRVRREVDCRLLYCYSSSIDDPEGPEVFSRTRQRAETIGLNGEVVFVEGTDPRVVNAIQRFATVLVQKSIREGFCLCVTEALWKGKPVVGTAVGGIPLQLRQAENGFLVDPYDTRTFAEKIAEIIKNPEMARRMGGRGREVVREGFLITRLLSDYVDLLNDVVGSGNARS